MTEPIFGNYVDQVLIPAVQSNRSLSGCPKQPASLFCDNCAAHCYEEALRKLAQHGILVITYPLHTWHIFQVLDVLLFRVLKPAKKYQRRNNS
jgi:hypothetical protein